MWLFVNEQRSDIRYSLLEGQSYNIGRIPSNEISVGNDVSISRLHGTIFVEPNNDRNGKTRLHLPNILFSLDRVSTTLRGGRGGFSPTFNRVISIINAINYF